MSLITPIITMLAAMYNQPGSMNLSSGKLGLLLPELANQLDKVHSVKIVHSGETITLQVLDGEWVVVEKANYPALASQVRELLLGLAQAQRLEPKTRMPDHYAALGLTDSNTSGGEASVVELKAQAGNTIAKVTLGKRRPTANVDNISEFYALVGNDPQTWLTEGQMPTIGASGAWLQRNLLELSRTRITGVTLEHRDGEMLHLVPKEVGKTPLNLEGLLPNQQLKNDYIIDDIADRFTRM
ncbi:hypothetical protein TI04_13015, partial [Achromatium sp. WMS2]